MTATTSTQTLADFLLARIAEDEAVARAALERNGAVWSTTELSDGTRVTGTTELGNPRSYGGDSSLWDDEGAMGMFAETAAHVAHWDPARVLAECEAKRRIVERYQRSIRVLDRGVVTGRVNESARANESRAILRLLALPYADHPDYREEWRV